MSQRQQVFSSYRALLKARDVVFKGDPLMYEKCTLEIRQQFRDNSHVNDQTVIEQLVQNAFDAASFLKASIIQGVKASESNEEYELRLNEEQVVAHLDKTVNINPIDADYIKREERRAQKKSAGKVSSSDHTC